MFRPSLVLFYALVFLLPLVEPGRSFGASTKEWIELVELWQKADPVGARDVAGDWKKLKTRLEARESLLKKGADAIFGKAFESVFGGALKASEIYDLLRVVDRLGQGRVETALELAGTFSVAKFMPRLNAYVTVLKYSSEGIKTVQKAMVAEFYVTEEYRNLSRILDEESKRWDRPYVPSWRFARGGADRVAIELAALRKEMERRESAMFEIWKSRNGELQRFQSKGWQSRMRMLLGHRDRIHRIDLERLLFNDFLKRWCDGALYRERHAENLRIAYLPAMARALASAERTKLRKAIRLALDGLASRKDEVEMQPFDEAGPKTYPFDEAGPKTYPFDEPTPKMYPFDAPKAPRPVPSRRPTLRPSRRPSPPRKTGTTVEFFDAEGRVVKGPAVPHPRPRPTKRPRPKTEPFSIGVPIGRIGLPGGQSSGSRSSSGSSRGGVRWVETWYDGAKTRPKERYRTVDGRKDGPFLSWWDNGRKQYEKTWVAGRATGPIKAYFKHPKGGSGLSYSGQLKDGRPVGTWSYWDEKGRFSRSERR